MAEANNVRVSDWDSDKLGQFIAEQTAGVFRRLEELRPYYEELWKRFDDLPKGKKILDCSTRTEYCDKILHKSIRSVQYALYGRKWSTDGVVKQFNKSQRLDQTLNLTEEEERQAEKQREAAEEKRYDRLKSKLANLKESDANFVFGYLIGKREEGFNLTTEEWEFIRKYREDYEAQQQPARDWYNNVLCKLPAPADVIREFASLGKRAAGRKYHPDHGGDAARMVQLNQVASWLEQLAR